MRDPLDTTRLLYRAGRYTAGFALAGLLGGCFTAGYLIATAITRHEEARA